jgi:hypothetical protein
MPRLSAAELLDVWEAGVAQAPAERALALLAVTDSETSRDAMAALTIGQRDIKLLALREGLWGPQMPAVVVCTRCRERLELTLDTREMLSNSHSHPPSEIFLSIGDYTVTFRLPTSLDVIAAAGLRDIAAHRALIFDRCLLLAQHGGVPINSGELPPDVMAEVVKSMAEADPLADIQLDLACPCCKYQWHAPFDIVSFLWTELEVWAWRILSDVHTLASAYGWCEQDILILSPTRRQFYLEMVGG